MNRFCFTSFTIALLPAVLLLASFDTAQAAQTCDPHIPLTTPDSDFTDHGDGTVTHKKTGLMWSKCVLGQSGSDCSNGNTSYYSWQEALVAADASTLAGYNDWRLPNIKELGSIVEASCNVPAINLSFFPNDTGFHVWSSSPDANNSGQAWLLDFYLGGDSTISRSSSHAVRLVRGG
ncbi:Lcl C-terminal domain-containing protein [Thiolapillus sp.]